MGHAGCAVSATLPGDGWSKGWSVGSQRHCGCYSGKRLAPSKPCAAPAADTAMMQIGCQVVEASEKMGKEKASVKARARRGTKAPGTSRDTGMGNSDGQVDI